MRNRNFILGVAFIMIILLVAMVGVFVYTPTEKEGADTDAPFGNTSATREGTQREDAIFGELREQVAEDTAEQKPAPMLRLVAEGPVSGAGFYSVTEGSTTVEYIRYVEKNTGNIRETPIATVAPSTLLSQKTLLRVAAAAFSLDGRTVLTQRLSDSSDTIFSYLGSIVSSTTSGPTLTGRPLPNDILSAALSADNTSIAYLLATDSGSTLYIERIHDGARESVWSSPLKNLTVRWDSTNVLVYANPTTRTVGAVWSIDPVSKVATVLFSNERGLAATQSRDGSKVLYSFREKQGGAPALRTIDVETGEVKYLSTASVVEKCTWGPPNSPYVYCAVPRTGMGDDFIDEVYKGTVKTDDVLWRYNLDTSEMTELADLYGQLKVRLDVEHLHASNDGRFLIFQTRDNDLLWALKLPE